MGTHNRTLGQAGETLAANWYRRRGYRLIDRNWRWGRRGELDLILRRGRTIVFCEVKTRSTLRFGTPRAAVDQAKSAQVRRLARRWMLEHEPGPCAVRFDVASVLRGRVTVEQSAF